MTVEIISLTDEAYEKRDYCDVFTIKVDGKTVLNVYDGEPEDNNLSRNFSDIFSVPELIEAAYNAGKNGEPLNIEWFKVNEL